MNGKRCCYSHAQCHTAKPAVYRDFEPLLQGFRGSGAAFIYQITRQTRTWKWKLTLHWGKIWHILNGNIDTYHPTGFVMNTNFTVLQLPNRVVQYYLENELWINRNWGSKYVPVVYCVTITYSDGRQTTQQISPEQWNNFMHALNGNIEHVNEPVSFPDNTIPDNTIVMYDDPQHYVFPNGVAEYTSVMITTPDSPPVQFFEVRVSWTNPPATTIHHFTPQEWNHFMHMVNGNLKKVQRWQPRDPTHLLPANSLAPLFPTVAPTLAQLHLSERVDRLNTHHVVKHQPHSMLDTIRNVVSEHKNTDKQLAEPSMLQLIREQPQDPAQPRFIPIPNRIRRRHSMKNVRPWFAWRPRSAPPGCKLGRVVKPLSLPPMKPNQPPLPTTTHPTCDQVLQRANEIKKQLTPVVPIPIPDKPTLPKDDVVKTEIFCECKEETLTPAWVWLASQECWPFTVYNRDKIIEEHLLYKKEITAPRQVVNVIQAGFTWSDTTRPRRHDYLMSATREADLPVDHAMGLITAACLSKRGDISDALIQRSSNSSYLAKLGKLFVATTVTASIQAVNTLTDMITRRVDIMFPKSESADPELDAALQAQLREYFSSHEFVPGSSPAHFASVQDFE
jgi:hypothetical protein